MSGAGNYCRTDSALPQSAGKGRSAQQLGGVAGVGAMAGWGPWGGGGGGDTIGGGGGGGGPGPENIYESTGGVA